MALRIRVSGGVAALATALACAGPAVAATVTVTTKADDLTPNDGSVSLREAITSVNAGNTLGDPDISNQNPGTYGTNDTIHFSIPLPPIPTISPASALPSITKRVLIDGTTQSGTGLYRVALDGTSAGAGVNGFNAIAPIEVLGFDIEHFSAAGIHLGHSFFGTSSAGSVIGENEIGTNPAGTAAAGNQSGVVADSPSDNIVLNVISGNGTGVVLNSDHNRVAENYIGLDAAGSAAVPNGTGVSVSGADNRIGDQGGRNVISGNASNGVFVTGSTNFIQSNFIGTDAGGTKPIPNGAAGVFLFGPLGVRPRTVSGTPGDPQRIWFNTGPGIHDGVPGDRLSANSIKGNAGGGIDALGPPGSLSLSQDRRVLTVHFTKGFPSGIETVEAFYNPGAPGCPGQGASFLGGAEVAASSKGAGTAKIVFGQPLKVGGGLTATLTDSTYGTSPFQCLPGGVVLPSNLFKILTAGGDSKGDVVLVLHAPDQGTFRAKAKFGSHAFGAATRTAPGAGNVKLKIHPGSAAQQALKGGTKLTVSVTVSFTPTGGVKRTKKTTVHVSRKAF